ncbi:MAG TPA: hypothetical protein ENO27_03265, partial [Caldithrix sp.]|nr:hypothetical protein [Caldithrix sp.]
MNSTLKIPVSQISKKIIVIFGHTKRHKMSPLDIIKEPIKDELKEFERSFHKVMKSNIPLLNIVINFIIRRKGKQMRPILVFLSAKVSGDIRPSTYIAASLI